MQDVLFAFWFLLPAAFANMAPIFAAAMPYVRKWDAPMDGGRSWKGKRILGAHKTWRGLVSGIIAATVVVWLQQWLVGNYDFFAELVARTDYLELPAIVLGVLFGVGAIGGDAVKSFFKRRRGISEGQKWFPFDQIDYVLGSLLLTLPVAQLSVAVYALMIVIWFALHPVATYLGWRLGLKSAPI